MKYQNIDQILAQIAHSNHTTPELVRQEMRIAMEAGQKSSNAVIRAKWDAIPRKGRELTLEEFIDYLVTQAHT